MRHHLRKAPFVALLAMLAVASPGYGALSAPTGTTTSIGVPFPAFSWTPVAGADHYQFEIDSGSSIGTALETITTRNTRATISDKTYPDGPYTWRVRAVNGTTNGPWSNPVNWTKTGVGPTLVSPADGDVITYPDPVILRWSAVDGAFQYTVEIANSADMSGATSQTMQGTSYTPASWLAPGLHYWTVTAKDAEGNPVGTSPLGGTGSSFTWVWPSTVSNLNVVNAVDASAGATAQWTMFDPQFSWDPVSGAVKYQVEVNTDDITWSASSKVCCTDTVATTLTPKGLLPNATYAWRVRAVDAAGDAGPWTVGSDFTEAFDSFVNAPPSTPSVSNLRMVDNLGDPGTDIDGGTAGYQTQVPIVSWDPVPGASGYDVTMVQYVSGLCQWTTGGVPRWNVRTAATSFTPLASGWNNITPWPNNGTSVSTDSYDLTSGMSYCVRVTPFRDNASAGSLGTVAVSGDPTYMDPNDDGTAPAFQFTGFPSGNPCSAPCTNGYLGDADYLAPITGSTAGAVPLFTWNPVAGANGYFVIVARDAAFSTIVDYAFTHIPAYAPRAGTNPRTYQNQSTHYYWVVLPSTGANGSGAVTIPNSGHPQSFDRPQVGPDLVAPDDGATVSGQPTFVWDPIAGARQYELQVSTDPSFATGTVEDITTSNISYTSLTTSYPSDDLYWQVRAIDYNGRQQPWSASRVFHQTWPTPDFTSISNPTASDTVPTFAWNPVVGAVSYTVQIDQPSNGTVSTTVASTAMAPLSIYGLGDFKWRVRANFASTPSATAGPSTADQLFTRSIHAPTGEGSVTPNAAAKAPLLFYWDWKPDAKKYDVQVSRDSSFTSTLLSTTTEMSSLAPVLPTGSSDWDNLGQLYWRVAAEDTNGTKGTWSAPQSLNLGAKLVVTASAANMPKQTTKTITITVKDQGHAVSGAKVTASGAGITKTSKTTGSTGKVSFKVHPTKAGTITWSVSKSGAVSAKATTTVY